ncbi:MAG: hypothetical protein ACFFEO_10545 [Candidatus Thorarchaeota archaeon]
MSSKSKLIVAIVMLAVGAGLVPTGLVTNDYMRDQVYDGVPEALLGIKAEAVPTLAEEFPALSTPEILKGIFDQASAEVEPMLTIRSTPEVLRNFRDEAFASLPAIIEPAVAVQITNGTIWNAQGFYGSYAAALDAFFNDENWSTNTFGVFGFNSISEQMAGVNLSYTTYAQNTIMFTGFLDPTPGGPYFWNPGILTDLTYGTALDNFQDIFYWIWGPYGGWPNATLQAGYNVTWTQLSSFQWYYEYYFRPFIVPGYLGMSVAAYAPIAFYGQWANGSLDPTGVDLSTIKAGLPGGTKGGEVGVPDPTNITLTSCYDLWNESIPYSFANDSGIWSWMGALAGNATLQGLLMSTFNLTATQLNMTLEWLDDFMENLLPLLIQADTGYTLSQLATMAFFEHWANGTMFGESIIPNGFLGEIDSSWAGAPYFEVGLPTASGLSLAVCQDLWDPFEDNTFIYLDSFQSTWLPAIQGDTASQAALIAGFGLSAGQLTALLTWLGALIGTTPSTGRMADILEYNTGMTITELATAAFYEQWAVGTINGESLIPEGFLARRDPPIMGPPYFEVGLMYAAGINYTQAAALWNENSDYSLVTVTGVNKWYKAEQGNAIFDTLKDENNDLNDFQMAGILTWLPQFRDVIVNILAKEDLGLTLEPYDLGQTLAISLGAGGGALAALGVVVLILSRRT